MKLILPNDADLLEKELYNFLVSGLNEPQTTAYLYSKVKDPINKFIMAYVFEMKNTRQEAEIATGLSKATIWYRIKMLKKELGKYAKEIHLI